MHLFSTLVFAVLSTTAAEAPSDDGVQSSNVVTLGGNENSDETLPTEEHVVQPGDTLWDLSARYLNNPWYWPKVWSYNPHLTNPHFLYPGDRVRFYAGSKPSSDHEPIASTEPARVSAGDNHASPFHHSPRMMIQRTQFLTQKELAETGRILGAFDNKIMLSTYDTIYIKFNKNESPLGVGTHVVFFQKVFDVDRGIGRRLGYLTQITGTGVISEVGDVKNMVSAKITQTFEPIERGQYVAKQIQPISIEIPQAPNQVQIKGTVILGEYRTDQIYAQYHYVFVDRGSKDGVRNGNSFVVLNTRDQFNEPGVRVPTQVIGKLVVVDARDTASLTMVVQSLRELMTGDVVEMRR